MEKVDAIQTVIIVLLVIVVVTQEIRLHYAWKLFQIIGEKLFPQEWNDIKRREHPL